MKCKRLKDWIRTAQAGFFSGFHSRSHGFTLIEIMLAVFILGLVLSTIYAAYSGTLTLAREMEYENDVYRNARTAMDRIIRDFSSVQPAGGVFKMKAEKELAGTHEFYSLFFSSAAHLAFSENEVDGGIAQIGYFVEEDTGGGYSLRRSDLQNYQATKEKSKSSSYLICPNVDSLIFKFYDLTGKEYDSWDSSSNMSEQKNKVPAVIKIELSIANSSNKDAPYKFMTKIFLPAIL
jgi:prepilin-type N-terminal cleavage/methylation domain-containing protein